MEVGERLRRRHVIGHRQLVVEARLGIVEAGLQVEDRLAVLDRDDASRGETAAVADPIDLVHDRHHRISRPEEVGVQRVDEPLRFDRAGRRHQRLTGDLTAEHALALLLRRDSPRNRLTSIGSRSSSVTRSSRASCTGAMLAGARPPRRSTARPVVHEIGQNDLLHRWWCAKSDSLMEGLAWGT